MGLKTKPGKNKQDFAGPVQGLWRKLGSEYLLTNDSGQFTWLKEKELQLFTEGKLAETNPKFKDLSAKGFVRTRLDFTDLAAKWRTANAYLGYGPGLHILVLTLRCNHKCVYCQSSAASSEAVGADMSPETAKKSLDFAFQTTSPSITIEFQGGEPLLNWETLSSAVTYARLKAKTTGKNLSLALVTNFSLMTQEKADFLLSNEVSICTSLDGPEVLHNKNRTFLGGNSYKETIKWLKYFNRLHNTARGKKTAGKGYKIYKPGALLTITKNSLPFYKEIIDEYAALGQEDIFLRPLAPIGYAKKFWEQIGYGAADFAEFYLNSLRYILKLNRRGVVIREKTAAIMLEKILNFKDPGFLDSRCPCGAAIGQLAYNYNGDIYTCDEGRMVGWTGDELFKMGNVLKDSYQNIFNSGPAKSCVLSSNLEAQPVCSRCVYKPYCGVCPVYNYETQGSLWGNMPANGRCGLFKGIFDALFLLLRNPKDAALLGKWATQPTTTGKKQ